MKHKEALKMAATNIYNEIYNLYVIYLNIIYKWFWYYMCKTFIHNMYKIHNYKTSEYFRQLCVGST